MNRGGILAKGSFVNIKMQFREMFHIQSDCQGIPATQASGTSYLDGILVYMLTG
jgi:hypothetical protein